jgi:hypothetical protein
MPEGLFSDEYRIHDFTIEQPKRDERPFVAERDITPKDWQAMQDLIAQARHERGFIKLGDKIDSYDLSDVLVAMATLFPDRRDKIIVADDSSRLDHEIDNIRGIDTDNLVLARHVAWQANRSLLFPNTTDQTNHFDDLTWGVVKRMLEIEIDQSNVKNYAIDAVKASIADPSKMEDIRKMSDESWGAIIPVSLGLASGDTTANYLVYLRLIEPERYDKIVTDDTTGPIWDKLNESLASLRGDWATFAQLAMKMKILSAKSARITENGLELEMPPPIHKAEDFPPLPPSRSF